MKFFLPLLTVVFVVLKVCGLIPWPWLWVFTPAFVAIGLAILMTVFAVVLATAEVLIEE